jgi:membrane fusion protein (multidrug efflux system)
MKRKYILPIIGAVLVILILIKIIHNSKKKKTESTKPVAEAILAECIIAKDTIVDFSFKAVGHTRANESVELVSELSLRLVSIHFSEGSKVKKGDLLFQMDDSEWKANLLKVKAMLDLAVETEKRNKTLLASGGISQQTFDESVSNRRVLEAEEETLNVMIGKAKIMAPFSGIIGIRNVSVGAFVTPGTKLALLEDLSRLKIDFTIPETYVNMIRKGERFNFRLDGFPGSFNAVIEAMNPSVNTNSGNLEVLAVVEDPDPELKAGVTVSITLASKSANPTIYIPSQALVPTPGGYHVYVLRNGKANFTSVTTGLRSEKMVEIVQGVNPADSILVTGFMKVRPGTRVKIIKVW